MIGVVCEASRVAHSSGVACRAETGGTHPLTHHTRVRTQI